MALANRMARELSMLSRDPPPGIAAWPLQDSIKELRAQISGPEDTVYDGGVFLLSVSLPDRWVIC